MDSIVEESKKSLADIPAVTSNEANQVIESSGKASGAPQGDQHTTMSTSTPMAVENSPPVRQRTSNDRLQQFKERYREIAGSLTYARDDELNSLRSELADTQLHVTQLQQLLEEDSEAHPSNRAGQSEK